MRCVCRTVGEIAVVPLLRPLRSSGIDLALIESSTLLLVFEQVVGSRYVLELRLRFLVVRMQIGMEFACQLLECVLDLRIGRVSTYSKSLVGILHAPILFKPLNRGRPMPGNHEIILSCTITPHVPENPPRS